MPHEEANSGSTDETVSFTDVRGPFRLGVYGNFFRTGGWNIVTPSQRGLIDQNSDSEHKSLNGRLEYSPASNLSLFLRGAYYDESRNTGTPLRISSTRREFIAGGGNLQTDDGSEWQLTLFSHLSRFRENYSEVSEDRTEETPTQHQVVPSTDVGGAFTWQRSLITDHLVLAGTDFRLIDGKSEDTFFAPDSTVVADHQVSKGRQHFWGFFAQDVYTPIDRCHTVCRSSCMDAPTSATRYKNHRFPVEILSHAAWRYLRFCLSFRDIEVLLFERGMVVTSKTIRNWEPKHYEDTSGEMTRRKSPG